jgi:hypothetical protein
MPEKGDVSDYLENHSADELFALMRAAPAWSGPPASAVPTSIPSRGGKTIDAAGLKLKRGDGIVDKEQNWLVRSFLPADTLIVVAGQVGIGKTTMCLSWGASITNGLTPILGDRCEPRNVLMLSNEDPEAQTHRNFTKLGGNLSHLYVEDEDSDLPWGLGDIPALEAHIAELKPALVIIDSLTTHKPSKCDLNVHGDVAPVLVELRSRSCTCEALMPPEKPTGKMQRWAGFYLETEREGRSKFRASVLCRQGRALYPLSGQYSKIDLTRRGRHAAFSIGEVNGTNGKGY